MLTRMSNFHQRLLVSFIAIAFILAIIYLSHELYFRPFFTLVIGGIIGASIWEFSQLGRNKGYKPHELLGVLGGIAYTFAIFASTQSTSAEGLPELLLFLILLAGFFHYFVKDKQPLINLSLTFFGIIYLAVTLACMISINYFFHNSQQDGRWWLLYLLAITKLTDTGAYFSGKQWGRHFMSPFISPKKTWEGAAGGLFLGVLASLLFYFVTQTQMTVPPIHISLFQSIWLGILLSIAGQLGDLAESLLKRDAGVKDSNQLPGLGGVLDVVDSLIFTAPVLYMFLKIQFS